MEEIRLHLGRWKFDPSDQLGPEGGFGAVYRGENDKGESVAVKRLKLTADEAAHRELEIASKLTSQSFKNILPVFDSGQDSESGRYFIVMPEAEISLQAYLDQMGSISEIDAIRIMRAIVDGLQEVPDLVHRDLKPGNILKHEGEWKIADFGIAKFVQESTSLRTLKQCLSPPYAAPEQWRLESANQSTDIYALGCIGYTLLSGSPPFPGPSVHEYQQQHLNHDVPEINVLPQLKSLIHMMLRKVSRSRPSIDRVSSILETLEEDVNKNNNTNHNSLAKAGAAVAEQESKKEAERERKVNSQKERRDLGTSALKILWDQVEVLFRRIENTAPTAKRSSRGEMVLGKGEIEISEMGVNLIEKSEFQNTGWDVIVGAIIVVKQSNPQYIWSSSLWYAKRHKNDNYRWREASYFSSPFSRERRNFDPYFLDEPYDADIAHSNIMGAHQVAWGPKPIDDENADDFFNRWMEFFALAAQGNLSHPSRLPLDK